MTRTRGMLGSRETRTRYGANGMANYLAKHFAWLVRVKARSGLELIDCSINGYQVVDHVFEQGHLIR
jgi:hypothetical protein